MYFFIDRMISSIYTKHYIYIYTCVSPILLQYVRVLLLLRQSESKVQSHVSGLLQQISADGWDPNRNQVDITTG